MLILLLACSADDDAPGTDPSADTAEPVADAIEPPPYSGGTCPTLTAGWNEGFVSGDDARAFRLDLPADPEGAPVIFLWHWLGGSADQMVEWSGFEDFPDDHGAILIAPQTRGLPYEWDTYDGANTPDLLFFDDMLSCLAAQYAVDMTRIHASGMSAGGLWTVTLTKHRSEWLASTAPLSGGATEYTWAATDNIPVMLTWGGPSDTYGSFSFDEAQYILIDQLSEGGHFTVLCEHDDGHTLPPGGVEYVWSFFEAHPKGVDPLPWAKALPDALPAWCAL